jgi:hypothetical protein
VRDLDTSATANNRGPRFVNAWGNAVGSIVQFPDLRITPAVRRDDPATVIILPVIRVERVPRDLAKMRIAARRFARKSRKAK